MVVDSSYFDEESQLIHKYFSTFTVRQGGDGYWSIPVTSQSSHSSRAECFNEAEALLNHEWFSQKTDKNITIFIHA